MESELPRKQLRPDGPAGSSPVPSAMTTKTLLASYLQGDFAEGQRTLPVKDHRVGTFATGQLAYVAQSPERHS